MCLVILLMVRKQSPNFSDFSSALSLWTPKELRVYKITKKKKES